MNVYRVKIYEDLPHHSSVIDTGKNFHLPVEQAGGRVLKCNHKVKCLPASQPSRAESVLAMNFGRFGELQFRSLIFTSCFPCFAQILYENRHFSHENR